MDNESLEFLGDAVLGLVIADALCRAFPQSSEGQKSKIKATMVSTAALAELAEQLAAGGPHDSGSWRGEDRGRRKQALLADTCEALIAAIYIDGGLEPARQFIMREMGEAVEAAGQPDYFGRDYKSRLQEALQALGPPVTRSTASPAKWAPNIARCFTSKWSCRARSSLRAWAAPRRTPSRRRRRQRCSG